MKKITLTLCALLVTGLLLVSCGGGGPKEAASAFITAVNKMDLKTARNYATDSAKMQIDQMSDMIKNIPADKKQQYDQEVAKRAGVTVTIKEVKQNGDRATVTFTTSDDPTRTDSVHMVKQSGKWLATLN